MLIVMGMVCPCDTAYLYPEHADVRNNNHFFAEVLLQNSTNCTGRMNNMRVSVSWNTISLTWVDVRELCGEVRVVHVSRGHE